MNPGLIESILWDNGYILLDRHMTRLKDSAAHFGYPADTAAIRAQLDVIAKTLNGPHFVRLVLARTGACPMTAKPYVPLPTPLQFVLSETPVQSTDDLYRHKTTQRDFYDNARAACGYPEILFTNERGELTEGSFTNLFIEKNGHLVTPPVSCGLLPGTLRAELLATGKAVEGILKPAELTANPVFLGNSVRGLLFAKMVVL